MESELDARNDPIMAQPGTARRQNSFCVGDTRAVVSEGRNRRDRRHSYCMSDDERSVAIEPRTSLPPNFRLEDFSLSTLRFSADYLYGRSAELEELEAVWARFELNRAEAIREQQRQDDDDASTASPKLGTLSSSELVLIHGSPGVGKTALAAQLRNRVRSCGGRFCSGKFDIQQKAQPYTAFVVAFSQLCDDIIAMGTADPDTGTHDEFVLIRDAIHDVLGSEGVLVLMDVIPKLKLIVGDECESNAVLTELDHKESKSRFDFMFRQFVRTVCSHRPVVLLIDDLQWADLASLELMETLITDRENSGLLMLGCFRDNEVDDTHPLAARLREIEKSSGDGGVVTLTRIAVGHLVVYEVNELIADVLSSSTEETRGLAEIVHRRTLGNVFFVIEFLKSLREEGLFEYSFGTLKWRWDENEISSSTSITDNVVDLMRHKIERNLSMDIVNIILMAACLGSSFDTSILEAVVERVSTSNFISEGVFYSDTEKEEGDSKPSETDKEVLHCLNLCVKEGLLEQERPSSFRFVHDHIQQAVLTLVPEPDLCQLQYRIGEAIVEGATFTELERFLFVAVDLLNQGLGSVVDEEKKYNLARLNLRSGKKAMESSAFAPAASYFKTGISLLSPDHWQLQYELSSDLFSSIAEAEYCSGDLEQLQQHLDAVLSQNDKPLRDRFRAYCTLIYSLTGQNMPLKAIDTSLDVLAQLGVSLPRKAGMHHVVSSFVRTRLLLSRRTIESLQDLHPMQDEDKLMAMQILDKLATSCYMASPNLFVLTALKMLRITVRYGVSKNAAPVFALYGTLLCGPLHDLNGGNKCGKLALSLIERLNANGKEARVRMIVHYFISHWSGEPLPICLKNLVRGYEQGLKTGDMECAFLCIRGYCEISLHTGRRLSAVESDMRNCIQQARDYGQAMVVRGFVGIWQIALNLMGSSTDPTKLSGEAMDQDEMLDYLVKTQNVSMLYSFKTHQMWVAFLFGDYELAWELIEETPDLEKKIPAAFLLCRSVFYEGLIAFAKAQQTGCRRFKTRAAKAAKKVEGWVKAGDANCIHMLHLLKAESAALKGKADEAQREYNSAITSAGRSGFLIDRAIANEKAGEFFAYVGQDQDWAAHYLCTAYHLYEDWGALGKAAQLRKKHFNYFIEEPSLNQVNHEPCIAASTSC